MMLTLCCNVHECARHHISLGSNCKLVERNFVSLKWRCRLPRVSQRGEGSPLHLEAATHSHTLTHPGGPGSGRRGSPARKGAEIGRGPAPSSPPPPPPGSLILLNPLSPLPLTSLLNIKYEFLGFTSDVSPFYVPFSQVSRTSSRYPDYKELWTSPITVSHTSFHRC